MKKKLVIIAILLLIAALVGFLAIKIMYKKVERNVATELSISINPIQFATFYKNIEDSANKIYLNKVVQLTGIISTHTTDTTNQQYLTIALSDTLPSINCTLNEKYKSINVQDTITIKGICVGMVSDINLIDCIILESKKYVPRFDSTPNKEKKILQKDTSANQKVQNQVPPAKSVFKTSKAKIIFDAGGGIEDITAVNNQVEASIDTNGSVNFKLAMLQFKFADVLMQQHFNEEYVESSKFSTAKFTGTILNNTEINLNKNGTYKALLKGRLTIHGVTRDVKTNALLVVKNKLIKATAALKIILADFAVKSAAADEADIKITANF